MESILTELGNTQNCLKDKIRPGHINPQCLSPKQYKSITVKLSSEAPYTPPQQSRTMEINNALQYNDVQKFPADI